MNPVIVSDECAQPCCDGCYVLGCWKTRTAPADQERSEQ